MKEAAAPQQFRVVDSALTARVFHGLVALALLSLAVTVAGKWFGERIAMGGHTDDTTVHAIVMGDNLLAVPANMIRFEQARRSGDAERLDLYVRYPAIEGYSRETRDAFNHAGTSHSILFLGFSEQIMSRDMSGRFGPIYSSLILRPETPGPAGIVFYEFPEKSGYLGERLAVAERPGRDPFVARCLVGAEAEKSLAPCERDILVGERLSLTYRFPERFLGEWQALDAAVENLAASLLGSPVKTASRGPRLQPRSMSRMAIEKL